LTALPETPSFLDLPFHFGNGPGPAAERGLLYHFQGFIGNLDRGHVLSLQKPWFLALLLESLELLRLGFDPNYGIDKYLLSRAAGRKKIVEMESLDYQIDLLSKFSDQEQELFLRYTVKDLHILKQELDKLTQAWKSGDAKGLESIVTRSFAEDSRMSSIYEKLILERNRSMAAKIEEFLRNKVMKNGRTVAFVGPVGLMVMLLLISRSPDEGLLLPLLLRART
jgi:uncharacterized protein YbaP (TraB family)